MCSTRDGTRRYFLHRNQDLLARFGFEHSLKDIDEMIQEKDIDQDGRISFDEFYRILSRDASSIGK